MASVQTIHLQPQIDSRATSGGGRVTVPRGRHVSSPIQLRDGIELHLERGSELVFVDDRSAYPLVETDYEGEPAVRCVSPVSATGCHNISITGEGTIDGSGQVWRHVKRYKLSDEQWATLLASGGVTDDEQRIWFPSVPSRDGDAAVKQLRAHRAPLEAYEPWRDFLRPNLLKFTDCRNVTLDGPLFTNSPAWCLHLLLCEDVVIRNVRIFNPHWAQNGDALDIDACRNVLVEHSHFDAGDDAICIKSGKDEAGRNRGRACENIDVRNCTVLHGHGGVTIGSEMSGGVRNVRVANCIFRGTDIGLRFKTTRGRGGTVENCTFENIAMHDIAGDAISLNMYYTKAPPEPISDRTPTFRAISFRNITCDGAKRAIELKGLPERPIHDIRFDNITIRSFKGIEITDAARITLNDVQVRVSEGSGLTTHRVEDLRCNGLNLDENAEEP